MYNNTMGNCCKKKQKRNVVLLLVGLDNAGKTVTIKGLAGENLHNSIPTVGFSTINLKYMDVNVTIYDLGGGPDIRGIWHRYFVDAHGVIFVIDSSDYARLNEAKEVLQELLSHEKISGKPVLLLANKQDTNGALDELDLAEKLELEKLVNAQKCPTLMESCSATEVSKNSKIDPGIKNGYKWLLNCILRDFKELNERVDKDIEEQRFIEKQIRQKQMLWLSERDMIPENDIDLDTLSDPFKPISELVSEKKELVSIITEDNSSNNDPDCVLPISNGHPVLSEIYLNGNTFTRPKSALDGVKKQLEKTSRRSSIFSISSNKTAPVTLFTPRTQSPVPTVSNLTPVENSNANIKTLTVTELPNTIEDMSIENHVGDLFMLNRMRQDSPQRLLPPIYNDANKISEVTWVKPLKKANTVQNDFDRILKDVS